MSNRKITTSVIFITGTILAGCISFLNAPVLTRCLSTELYVEYSMFMALNSVITAISYMGYDSAYMRFYHNNNGFDFFVACLKYPLVFLGMIAVALIVLRTSFLSYILGSKITIIECLLFCLYLLVKLLARFTLLTMRMESKAWNYVIADCLERLLFILLVIAIKLIRGVVSFDTVLLCFIVGYSIEIIINSFGFRQSRRSLSEKAEIVTGNIELFRFGVFLGITNSVMFCIPLIQKAVVKSLLDIDDTAIYFAASIFQTAISLISISINNIWEPLVYEMTNKGGNLKPIFHKYGIFISWLLLSILSVVLIMRKILVLVLAQQYHDVYLIAPCVTFSACMTIFYNYYSIGIEIQKKTWIRSIIPVIECVISISLLCLTAKALGLCGVALAMLIGSFTSKLIGIAFGLKLYGTDQSLSIPLICCGSSMFISVCSLLLTDTIYDVIIGFLALIFGFVAGKREILSTFKDIIPQQLRKEI